MTGNARPTPEQFDEALAIAERDGIGVERALLMVQSPAIAQTQQAQWLNAHMPAITEAFRALANTVTEIIHDLMASPAWPMLMQVADDIAAAEKREARRERHVRWQARKRSR